MIDVSIIIVNYNTKELLSNCLDSIIDNTNGINYEIVVVDNASNDDSVAMLKDKYHDKCRVIENEENLGFGKANNIGVRASQGKYIFLLNSDTILINNAVLRFFNYAEGHNKNSILGSYLLDNELNIIHSFGDFQDRAHIFVRIAYLYFPFLLKMRNRIVHEEHKETAEKDVDFITGADMFMAKAVFSFLGGFDEQFFMYCEDEEFCRRAAINGITRRVIPGPQIIHMEGKSLTIKEEKRKMMVSSYRKLLNL